jgi:isoaspartyl peptidase/L-asparaginase-like protein (Ntn-hydrolase superfamily)
VAQRLRQSSAAFEEALAEQMEAERRRAEQVRRRAMQRAAQRRRQRVQRHGTVRFIALVLMLVATAALVTVGMFQLLFLVMG